MGTLLHISGFKLLQITKLNTAMRNKLCYFFMKNTMKILMYILL